MGRTDHWHDPSAPEPNSLVPAAGVLAINEAGEILLQRRRDTGDWALPMGKQEIGETVAECAIRETHEETGVLVEVTGILGVFSDPAHLAAYSNGEVRQEFEVTLIARPVAGWPAANDEASDVRWVPPDQLDSLVIHPTMRRQLDHWLIGDYPHID